MRARVAVVYLILTLLPLLHGCAQPPLVSRQPEPQPVESIDDAAVRILREILADPVDTQDRLWDGNATAGRPEPRLADYFPPCHGVDFVVEDALLVDAGGLFDAMRPAKVSGLSYEIPIEQGGYRSAPSPFRHQAVPGSSARLC